MRLHRVNVAAALVVTAFAVVSFADLVGVGDELSFPLIVFNSQGTTTYDAASDLFSIEALPIAIRFTAVDRPRTVDPTGEPPMEDVSINILVDDNGDLIGGVPGDDLIVIGEVDSDGNGSPDYSSVLLTGEVKAFGFQGPGGGAATQDLANNNPTDLFDFSFQVTGGALAALFTNGDIGVVLVSESSSFDGRFTVSFGGLAKGNVGLVPARCGDGNLDPGEECDDGNSNEGDGCSTNCTLEEECQECCGKVTTLTLQYSGSVQNADVTITAKRGHTTVPVFDEVVNPGDTFTIVGPQSGNPGIFGTLGTEISIFVNGELNTKIHTSCSRPIGPGLISGDFEVVSGESKNGGLLCPLDDDLPDCDDSDSDGCDNSDSHRDSDSEDCDDNDSDNDDNDNDNDGNDNDDNDGNDDNGNDNGNSDDCDDCDGKVTVLTLRYNGSIENAQIAIDAKHGPSTEGVFDALVNPGEEFNIVGPSTGSGGFAGTLGTEIDIFVNGELNTTVHTSCSQPIGPGLVSGDFEVVSGESKNGGPLCSVDGEAANAVTGETDGQSARDAGLDAGSTTGRPFRSLTDSACGAMGLLPLLFATSMMICVRRWRS